MERTFALSSVESLRRASHASTFDDAMAMLSLPGVPATPKNQTAAYGPTIRNGMAYSSVTPCRLVDTRNVNKPLVGEAAARTFQISLPLDQQGGTVYGCAIPANSAALSVNVTIVHPASGGYITVFPADRPQPFASSLNFRQGEVKGNEVITGLGTDGFNGFFSLYSTATSHVVVDVTGYFTPIAAQRLDCQQRTSPVVAIAAGGSGTATTPVCPVGYIATGGGCGSGSYPSHLGIYFYDFGVLAATNQHECSARNKSADTENIWSEAVCCRVPGA